MFSEFHIVRLKNAIRKIYGSEYYSLVNLEFIQKSFLPYFSTLEGWIVLGFSGELFAHVACLKGIKIRW